VLRAACFVVRRVSRTHLEEIAAADDLKAAEGLFLVWLVVPVAHAPRDILDLVKQIGRYLDNKQETRNNEDR
jgi:hypothetical protein